MTRRLRRGDLIVVAAVTVLVVGKLLVRVNGKWVVAQPGGDNAPLKLSAR